MVPLWVIFCSFLLLIAAAFDFAILIFAMSAEYGDLGFILAFGVKVGVVVLLGASSLGGMKWGGGRIFRWT